MKALFTTVGYILLGIGAFLVLYFVLAFLLARISVKAEPQENQNIAIYILTNGVHTDLVVPVNTPVYNWNHYVNYRHTVAQDASMEYVAFGWGDKGFYLETPTWAQLKVSTAFKAVTGLSSSAIHATFYREMVEDEFCRKIMLSQDQYRRLVTYIQGRFDLEDGKPIVIATNAHYGENDAFYEAKGSYHLFYTCNTWANEGLKACGQKACLWTPFYHGIFYHYRK